MESLARQFSIYALGGLGEVGKNMYCVENQSSIIIIDCGVKFPGIELPGVDYVIPDFTHLRNNRSKVKALIITHGHEDHIGAIPYFLNEVGSVPVYANGIAIELIKEKQKEVHGSIDIIEYNSNSVINFNNFELSFFKYVKSGIIKSIP